MLSGGALGTALKKGVGFNPTAILGASLLGWWSADRSDLITLSGSAITSWKDVVAAYNLVQGVSASRPVYDAASFGGSPGATFDGVDDELTLASVPFPVSTDPCEIWAIADQQALVADAVERGVFCYGGGGASTARRATRLVNSGTVRAGCRVGNGTTNTSSQTTGSPEYTGRHVVRHVVGAIGASNLVSNLDGGSSGSSTVSTATGTTRTRMGAVDSSSASNFWQGVVRDVLVTSPLTTAQATALMTWALARRN